MSSDLRPPTSGNDEVLVKVEGVSKKFCRSLKKSLFYGVQDILSDLNPFGNQKSGAREQRSEGRDQRAEGHPSSAADLRPGEFWAVNDVSFELRRGECLGLIGRNGAGKTTLLKMLNGLIKPDAGSITMRGRVGALIALGAGFNPILTGRENIYVNGSVLGLTKREIDEKLQDIIDFADIGDFIDSPVQSYSSGMQVRLGFAVATAMEPDVLLLDEVLAVGDAAFRNKCYRRVVSLRKKAAVIFVSHSMEQISRVCDHVLTMSGGRAAYFGAVAEGILRYDQLNDESEQAIESFLSVQPPITSFSANLPSTRLSIWEPLEIKIHIKSACALANFQVRIYFYNISNGFAAECRFEAKNQEIDLSSGESLWSITLESVPLKSGMYWLSINLIDSHGDLLVWCYKQHAIQVTGGYQGSSADCLLQLKEWKQLPDKWIVRNT